MIGHHPRVLLASVGVCLAAFARLAPAQARTGVPPSDIGSWSTTSTARRLPGAPQFYSPDIMCDDGIYKMWTTVGDRIRYYTSTDGITCSGGGTVFAAQVGPWEDDGGNFEGYQGGISDARVIKM